MRITDIQPGERLDRFLTSHLRSYARNQIQKIIKADAVAVNGRVRTKHYELQSGDVVEINDDILSTVLTNAEPVIQMIAAQFKMQANPAVPIEVVKETADYCIVNKPAGIVMHPGTTYQRDDTLAHGLLARYPELHDVGENALRPGIMHRLDKDVSGVIVVARTPEMYQHLKEQFQTRTVQKEYMALLHGVLSQTHGVIDFDIVRSKRNRTKMAAVPTGGGKPARTAYECVQQFQHYAYVRLHPETGRTHQIRVHCNAIGHPIVGDPVYHPKLFHARLQPGRLFLHAHSLKFHDLAGQPVAYTAPLPPDLQAILDDLYQTV